MIELIKINCNWLLFATFERVIEEILPESHEQLLHETMVHLT